MRLAGAAAAGLLAAVLAGCAVAPAPRRAPSPAPDQMPELAAFSARLSGREAVPANDSAAQGELVAVLNRNTGLLRWKLSFSGLSGPVRGGAFHSPGMSGEVAPPVVSLGRTVPARRKAAPCSPRISAPICSPGSGTSTCPRRAIPRANCAAR